MEGAAHVCRTGRGGNLGEPINTPGDEMFPTFRPNGDLYFSSNGHPGMGGLDIYIAKPDKAVITCWSTRAIRSTRRLTTSE